MIELSCCGIDLPVNCILSVYFVSFDSFHLWLRCVTLITLFYSLLFCIVCLCLIMKCMLKFILFLFYLVKFSCTLLLNIMVLTCNEDVTS